MTIFSIILALVLLGWGLRKARRHASKSWVRDEETRLVIAQVTQGEAAVLTLQRGSEVAFGPVTAGWTSDPSMAVALGNPRRESRKAGGDAPAGRYRVLTAADLTSATRAIRTVLGAYALVLRPEEGGRDVLLHGGGREAVASKAGGIALEPRALQGLLVLVEDPVGLRVVVERRDIRRRGWGRR